MAVWVGFIALYGIAVETGVVMVIYLHEALDKKLIDGPCSEQDIYDATFEGAVLRLRPKLMTVAVALLGLLPIMWSTGTGADVMKPIAAPMIGGMMSMGKLAHEEVVDGVKATFNVIDIKAKMKEMGMKETHHLMVVFTDAKSGAKLSDGEAKIKVIGPDKKEQVKELMGMEGGFGADFTMAKPGKYGVMAKLRLKDGKVRSVKFRYTVK